jgi:hypothetical protein
MILGGYTVQQLLLLLASHYCGRELCGCFYIMVATMVADRKYRIFFKIENP